jgi:hypothetical protein
MVSVNYGKKKRVLYQVFLLKTTFVVFRRASAAGMVIAVIIGGLTLFALLATMCSQRRKRSKAWASISL